ncbi:MAG: RimK family alpha-L-glutamate ligase [Bacilli bacterium]|nr:RimK family alpha-L-glutamate ligase [Bacilli bacterium]
MHGIIITNQEIRHNEYKIQRFKEEFDKLNVSLDVLKNDGTLAEISNGNVLLNIPKCDFVIYLDKDIYLARILEKANIRLFNRADFIKMCDDKMLTFIKCADMGIRMPDTFAGPLVYTSIEKPHLEFLDAVINKLGFPMVIKKVYGSLGEGVFRADNKQELYDLYQSICHNPILFQRYVSSSKGSSIRVIVIDGKVFGAFRRKNGADFRSNFGESAGSEKIENIEKYARFAGVIAEKLDIEYAGIDLLDDENGEIVLCEINSNAFFEEFEKTTSLNVAKAFAEMVVRKVYEQK